MPVQSSTKRRPLPDKQQPSSPDTERPVTLQNPLAAARGMILAVVIALIVWVAIGAVILKVLL